jgi:hypothetical protein
MSMYSASERAEIEATARRHLAERNGVPQKEIHIATREERRALEAAEQEARKAAADAERKARQAADVAAQRRHEIKLAEAYAAQSPLAEVDLAELFNAISDGFAGVDRRLSDIEARLGKTENGRDSLNSELKRLAARLDVLDTRDDRGTRDLREEVRELRQALEKMGQRADIEVRMLRVEVATLRKQPVEPAVVVVREH